MIKKKIYLSVFVVFLVFVTAGAIYYFIKIAPCISFDRYLNEQINKAKTNIISGQTSQISIANKLKADKCIILRSYLEREDSFGLVSQLKRHDISDSTTEEIVDSIRWAEGCYFYFMKDGHLMCDCYVRNADAGSDMFVQDIEKESFTLTLKGDYSEYFDPNKPAPMISVITIQ